MTEEPNIPKRRSMKVELTIISIPHGGVNSLENGGTKIYASIVDEDEAMQRIERSGFLYGTKEDMVTVQSFSDALGRILVERFEPNLVTAYKTSGDKSCVVDTEETDLRMERWRKTYGKITQDKA